MGVGFRDQIGSGMKATDLKQEQSNEELRHQILSVQAASACEGQSGCWNPTVRIWDVFWLLRCTHIL